MARKIRINRYNQRIAMGEHEGQPGEMMTVVADTGGTPLVMFATVQDDGYFTDEFYDAYKKAMESGD